MVYALNGDYDLVGVGFGPANIGLAIALEEGGWGGSTLFLERQTAPDWQSDMLLDGTDIQHNPLRDFVTPRNPQSAYSFLSFLKVRGRLLDYLNLGVHYALRKDYAEYIRWTARHFDRWVAYGLGVSNIHIEESGHSGGPRIMLETTSGEKIRARALSFGPGRSALVPSQFFPLMGDRVEHFTSYLSAVSRWKAQGVARSIAVVGASQSAVEIILDLCDRLPGTVIHSVQRGFGFRLKDTSPFTEHAYFPEFVDAYHASSIHRQRALTADLWRSNYSAADGDVISRLYLKLYEQRLDGRERVRMHTQRTIEGVERTTEGVALQLFDQAGGASERLFVDAVVLATGFRNFGDGPDQELWHPLLNGIAPLAEKREDGSLVISRTYRLEPARDGTSLPPMFVNGLCESTHGFGDAGSFSLLALRSATIATALAEALAEAPDILAAA